MDAKRATPESFAAYGSVVASPSGEATAADSTFSYWSDLAHYHIEGETEIGLCTVYRQDNVEVTWMEQHQRSPEILIPASGAFILPVMDEAGTVELFRVEVGECVVIGDGVWHSACIPVDAEQATYFVIFRRGTPHEDVSKKSVSPLSARG